MQGELFLSFIFFLDIILTHKFVTRVTILFIIYFFLICLPCLFLEWCNKLIIPTACLY